MKRRGCTVDGVRYSTLVDGARAMGIRANGLYVKFSEADVRQIVYKGHVVVLDEMPGEKEEEAEPAPPPRPRERLFGAPLLAYGYATHRLGAYHG